MQRVGLGLAHDPGCQTVDASPDLTHRTHAFDVAQVTDNGRTFGGFHAVQREDAGARGQAVDCGFGHPKPVAFDGPANGNASMLPLDAPNPIPRRHSSVAVLQVLKQGVDFPNMFHVGHVLPTHLERIKLGFPIGGHATHEGRRVHPSHPDIQGIDIGLRPSKERPQQPRHHPDVDGPREWCPHQSASGPWSRFLTMVKMVATATVSPSWSSTSTR